MQRQNYGFEVKYLHVYLSQNIFAYSESFEKPHFNVKMVI